MWPAHTSGSAAARKQEESIWGRDQLPRLGLDWARSGSLALLPHHLSERDEARKS